MYTFFLNHSNNFQLFYLIIYTILVGSFYTYLSTVLLFLIKLILAPRSFLQIHVYHI